MRVDETLLDLPLLMLPVQILWITYSLMAFLLIVAMVEYVDYIALLPLAKR